MTVRVCVCVCFYTVYTGYQMILKLTRRDSSPDHRHFPYLICMCTCVSVLALCRVVNTYKMILTKCFNRIPISSSVCVRDRERERTCDGISWECWILILRIHACVSITWICECALHHERTCVCERERERLTHAERERDRMMRFESRC